VLLDSTFDGNKAGGAGGAVSTFGSLSATNLTFVRNQSAYGGGLELVNHLEKVRLANVTFSQNIATVRGGGLDASSGAASLKNVTYSGNSAPQGGAIAHEYSSTKLSLTNTILNAGRIGVNCHNPGEGVISKGFNLSSDDSCNFSQPTDQVNVNPKLLGLANNGGLTQTHLLAPDSPARDAGTGKGANKHDQRGIARPQGDAVDIGAVEVTGNEPCWNTPPEPMLSKPKVNATIKKQPVRFDWQDTACASKYTLNIKSSSGEGVAKWNFKGLEYSQHDVSNLPKGKTYEWRAQACNGNKCAKSGWQTFQVE
jgi:predicted outer membrane repeat protein